MISALHILIVFLVAPVVELITPNFFVEVNIASPHQFLVLNYPKNTVRKLGNTTAIIGPFQENEPITLSLSLPVVPFRYVSRTVESDKTWNTEYFEQFQATVRYRSICAPTLYGPRCQRYCRAHDDVTGHYTCSNMGIKICLTGWTGSNCNIPVSSTATYAPAKTSPLHVAIVHEAVDGPAPSGTGSAPAESMPTASIIIPEATQLTQETELRSTRSPAVYLSTSNGIQMIKKSTVANEMLSEYFIVEHRFPGLVLMICLGLLLGVLLFLTFVFTCLHRDSIHPLLCIENWLHCRRQRHRQYQRRDHPNQFVHKVYSLPVNLKSTGGKLSCVRTSKDSLDRYAPHRMSTTSCPVGPAASSGAHPCTSSSTTSSNYYFAYEAIDTLPMPRSRSPKPYIYVSNEHLNV